MVTMLKFLKKLVSSTSQPAPAKASQQPDAAAIKQEADTAIRAGSVMKALDFKFITEWVMSDKVVKSDQFSFRHFCKQS